MTTAAETAAGAPWWAYSGTATGADAVLRMQRRAPRNSGPSAAAGFDPCSGGHAAAAKTWETAPRLLPGGLALAQKQEQR